MQRRALFSLINFVVLVVALVVLFAFPRYAAYAVYGLFGWFVASIPVVWLARGTPPVASPSGGASAARTPASVGGPAAAGRPLPSAPAPPAIGFCIYCAADLPAGADRCPACGHPVKSFG